MEPKTAKMYLGGERGVRGCLKGAGRKSQHDLEDYKTPQGEQILEDKTLWGPESPAAGEREPAREAGVAHTSPDDAH